MRETSRSSDDEWRDERNAFARKLRTSFADRPTAKVLVPRLCSVIHRGNFRSLCRIRRYWHDPRSFPRVCDYAPPESLGHFNEQMICEGTKSSNDQNVWQTSDAQTYVGTRIGQYVVNGLTICEVIKCKIEIAIFSITRTARVTGDGIDRGCDGSFARVSLRDFAINRCRYHARLRFS